MTIELEIRGKFKNWDELKEFTQKVNTLANLKQHRYRFSVLFTSGNTKGIDLQIRSHNNKSEVVLKIGRHTSSFRKEYKFPFSSNNFVSYVTLFYNLGFKNGAVASCQDWIYITRDNMEIKATACDKKIFNWEIEGTPKKHSVERLLERAAELKITPMTEREIKNYWKWMKKYANRPLNIKKLFKWYSTYLKQIEVR